MSKDQGPQLVILDTSDNVPDKDSCIAILKRFEASFANSPFKGLLAVLYYQEGNVLYAVLKDNKAMRNRVKAFPQWWNNAHQKASKFGGPQTAP